VSVHSQVESAGNSAPEKVVGLMVEETDDIESACADDFIKGMRVDLFDKPDVFGWQIEDGSVTAYGFCHN
jgi:hypothetical protein